MSRLPYLQGYPAELQDQAEALMESGELGPILGRRYPDAHEIRSSKALGAYVQGIKAQAMRNAAPLGKIVYDDKLHVVHGALGLHITSSHVQGAKVRKRRELRVSSVFKDAPAAFLHMIVVHELAHMKHAEHDQAFYKLCVHMEPEYHQIELDLRLYLTLKEQAG